MNVLPSVLIDERGPLIKLEPLLKGARGGGHSWAEIDLENATLKFYPINYTNPGYYWKLLSIKYDSFWKRYRLRFKRAFGYGNIVQFTIPSIKKKNQIVNEDDIIRDRCTFNPFKPYYLYPIMAYNIVENISPNNI